VPGFDLSNSPTEVAGTDLTGARLVMRTSAGTRGAVGATGADRLLTGGFVNAAATAVALHEEEVVTFLVTGESLGRDGDEDRALADYMTELLAGGAPAPGPDLDRGVATDHRRRVSDDLPAADLALACEVDRFTTAVEIQRRDGGLVVETSDG
jgi:2-phosphosulfolactate phosphatase